MFMFENKLVIIDNGQPRIRDTIFLLHSVHSLCTLTAIKLLNLTERSSNSTPKQLKNSYYLT